MANMQLQGGKWGRAMLHLLQVETNDRTMKCSSIVFMLAVKRMKKKKKMNKCENINQPNIILLLFD